MLKKILKSIFIIFICATFFICNSYATVPSIYIEDATTEENDEVTINLNLENLASGISSLSLNINYDESILEYVGSKHGKNLKSTVQMSEYAEKNKISIRIKGQDELKYDGTYYQLTFKKLNGNLEQVPVKLDLKEAKDANGNNVQCNVSNEIIYEKEQESTTEDEKTNEATNTENNTQSEKKENDDKIVIKPFEKTDVSKSETLDDIIATNVEKNNVKKDNLKYEVKDKDILEVLDNGNMIPKKDGITQVLIKQDNDEIGIMEVEVKNGEIKRITSQYKSEDTNEISENKEQNDAQEKEEKKSVIKKRK